jgi:hypothetical protein
MSEDQIGRFEQSFFLGDLNRFVGSGGEVLLKRDSAGPSSRIDVGDRFIGIGATHLIESLSRPPGPGAVRATTGAAAAAPKLALRAFAASAKDPVDDGYRFSFEPLPPDAYAETLAEVSGGAAVIPAETIPEGAIVLSFIDHAGRYTLETIDGSPGANWAAVTSAERHWNVGVATSSDFWTATFPSDDIEALTSLPPSTMVGSIRFGLSLLPDSRTTVRLEPVECESPSGGTSTHDFCLSGTAAGTAEINSPFPIGLRTEIRFRPVK